MRERENEIEKGVKPTCFADMTWVLLWATGAQSCWGPLEGPCRIQNFYRIFRNGGHGTGMWVSTIGVPLKAGGPRRGGRMYCQSLQSWAFLGAGSSLRVRVAVQRLPSHRTWWEQDRQGRWEASWAKTPLTGVHRVHWRRIEFWALCDNFRMSPRF